nr:HAMP domain-containing sensor histidine kinase [Mycobacterium malmoense]
MRVLSLRTIVVVAALSVITLVVLLGTWVWVGVTNDQYSQLDRRLDSVSSLGDINSLLNNVEHASPDQPMPDGNLVRTARIGDVTVSVPSNIKLPKLPNGYANTTIDGVQYRVRTFSAGPASIALAAPLAEAQHRINELHLRVLLICASVIGGTVVVGWVISLIMVNPFLLLAQQARAINAQSSPDEVQVRGVREAVEIAEAVEGMLARIGKEQQRTKAALESARDFAAVASHELRTPLTAMRTNLEVLSTLDLPREQRQEVIGDVIRTQSRIEGTLTALERLAQGELTTVDDFVPFDITELLDRAAHDALRVYPEVEVSLVPSPTVVVCGRIASAPNAPLGRSPTGRPLPPGSKALTGRVKLVAGMPALPRDAAPPPPDAPTADTSVAETAETPVAAPPMAPGFANMPIIDCSGCIICIGACIICIGACITCGTAPIIDCTGSMNEPA